MVADHDLLSMGRSERIRFRRHSVGFVWQQTARNLLPYLTAGENVSLVGAVGRQSSRRRAVLVDELAVRATRRPLSAVLKTAASEERSQ